VSQAAASLNDDLVLSQIRVNQMHWLNLCICRVRQGNKMALWLGCDDNVTCNVHKRPRSVRFFVKKRDAVGTVAGRRGLNAEMHLQQEMDVR